MKIIKNIDILNKIMNRKIASEIAIGIILLLVIVIGGIFWLQVKKQVPVETVISKQQPAVNNQQIHPQAQAQPVDETANWQTYVNAKLGLEIKYPANWKSLTPPNGYQGINLSKDGNAVLFSVIYYKSMDDISIGKKFADLKNDLKDENATDATFMGYAAIQTTFTNAVLNLSETHLYVNKNGSIYEIEYNNDDSVKISQQILSTFKFTDNQITVKTPKQVIIDLLGQNSKGVNITIEKATDSFIRASIFTNPGGYMTFAAKVNGTWKKVLEGQDCIKKDLAVYNFPQDMTADCN